MDQQELERIVSAALAEDLGRAGDITSQAVFPQDVEVRGKLVAREAGVLAGMEAARMTFSLVEPALRFDAYRSDGDELGPGYLLAQVRGSARGILAGERTALNFLQHLSGIATLTARFVAFAGPYRAQIYDTRKTTPGLRALEKAAVRAGGGQNHRTGLGDAILIKDNHLAAAGGITEAVGAARQALPGEPVEVEADTWEQMKEALAAGAEMILLDNWEPERVRSAVEYVSGRAVTEASGGITLENVAGFAATGVDRISVGRITQGAPPLDISLELEL